ncbi:MAG: hypothetical protein HY868_05600 [Chloroflexi bacterium]|nr:hypothetical protein [Chloroflexota bacterium]
MSKIKTLVMITGVALLIAVAALMLLSAPQSVSAQGPTPTPKPPNAVVSVVPVAANATKDPNVITGTIKTVTDTAVGEYNLTIAMGTTGLNNVPINVPVTAQCVSDDAKNPGKPAWSLIKPAESKATLAFTNTKQTKFTPDVVGWFAVTCNLGGGGEVGGVRVYANTFVGITDGKCETCHATKVVEWKKTGHAKIFTEEIDVKPTHYTESCVSCHVTGYFVPPVGAGSGGFKDAATKAGWKMPTWKEIEAGGNWDKAPAPVKNMANIQCEQCHGPAGGHVKGEATMATSFNEGVCNICHNGSSRHDKGEQLKNAGHADRTSPAFAIEGIGEQACVRCHSGAGYVTFTKNPTNPAAWENEKQTISCATCHDPHDDKNAWQLRISGTAQLVGLPFKVTKEVGLSATCFECHNSRVSSEAFAAGTSTSTPHYSSIAELISDTGGVTYGATVPNSPHGTIVGVAPVANPAYDAVKNPDVAKFLWSSPADTKGNIPGPCVACHMWAPISDQKDANYDKVGGHSFNTKSPDGKFDYTASCKSCHGDQKSFNLTAKADYDGNGKTEGVQDEVKGLLNVVWKTLEAKGFKKVDTGYPYATLPQGADLKLRSAWFNFRLVYGVMWGTDTGNGNEGKAQAMHNFKRSVALLQLSLKDLNGSLPAGMTEMK